MERAAVVSDDDRAVRDRRGELQDIAIATDHWNVPVLLCDRLGLSAFAGAREHDDRVAVVEKPLGDFTIAFIAPMFGLAVQTAGVQTEQRPVETDARGAHTLARFLADVHR